MREGDTNLFFQRGRNIARGGGTYRAVVLLLQQGGHVSSDWHLLRQLLILQADPPPQLLQEAQQTRPALGTRLQMRPAGKRSIRLNCDFLF